MNKSYSYIVSRDYGFAPNPFYGFLTLATCKPFIRKKASIGDIIIGNSSKKEGHKLIYIAIVSKIISYDDYWNNIEYDCKKPVMNGSLKKLYGDNIYHHAENNDWIQEDSHHSREDGTINTDNLKRDTGKTDHVLICKDFYYFGRSAKSIPLKFSDCICTHRGHSVLDLSKGLALWKYISKQIPEQGLIDFPKSFKKFKRYKGEAK